MTYRGAIKNGVVVFDQPVPLEEGTLVDVHVSEGEHAGTKPRPLSRESLERIRDLRWTGDPEELKRLMEMVQEERNNDLIPMDDEPLK